MAIVQLQQCGVGTEEELAAAFDRHVNPVQRYLAGFAEGGVRGLLSERSGPKGPWKITPELRAKILWVVLRERAQPVVAGEGGTVFESARSPKGHPHPPHPQASRVPPQGKADI